MVKHEKVIMEKYEYHSESLKRKNVQHSWNSINIEHDSKNDIKNVMTYVNIGTSKNVLCSNISIVNSN